MSEQVKHLIETFIDDIDNNNFDPLYNATITNKWHISMIRELTDQLWACEIDPILYLDYIPSGYFAKADIKHYDIPEHIKRIKKGAFFETPIESITLHDKIVKVDSMAFAGCGELKFVTIQNPQIVINTDVFMLNHVLHDIYFNGTFDQYINLDHMIMVERGHDLIIHCTDQTKKQLSTWEGFQFEQIS